MKQDAFSLLAGLNDAQHRKKALVNWILFSFFHMSPASSQSQPSCPQNLIHAFPGANRDRCPCQTPRAALLQAEKPTHQAAYSSRARWKILG